jgi:hypothetical protein
VRTPADLRGTNGNLNAERIFFVSREVRGPKRKQNKWNNLKGEKKRGNFLQLNLNHFGHFQKSNIYFKK